MAVLVVRDITDVHDLIDLIAHLTQALATGDIEDFLDEGTLTLSKSTTPSTAQIEDLVRFDDTDDCTNTEHRFGCSCRADAAATDPRVKAPSLIRPGAPGLSHTRRAPGKESTRS